VDSGLEPTHGTKVERQKVEEQSSLSLGGKRDHFALLLLGGGFVDVLQVGGLAAEARAVIHDLAINFAGCEVDETQDFPQRAAIYASLPSLRDPARMGRGGQDFVACTLIFYITGGGNGQGYSGYRTRR
jgi:hypothetical protein